MLNDPRSAMKTQIPKRHASETGYTLITTMVLTLAAAVLMAGTLSRTYSGSKLNDRNNAYIVGACAAEAATEKALAAMMIDFANGGEALLSNNLTSYQTRMLPTTSENSYWSNYVFSDAMGHTNRDLLSCLHHHQREPSLCPVGDSIPGS